MSLFGKLDADQIPDNPFGVGEGSYTGYVSRAETRTTQNGVDKVVLNYKVTDEDSEYYDNEASEWLTYYPDLTPADLAAMEPKERSAVTRDLSRLKQRLSHLGVEDVEGFDLKELVGIPVEFTVAESEAKDGSGTKYYNIRYVSLVE